MKDGESELGKVELIVLATGNSITSWSSYSYSQKFGEPLESWEFCMGGAGVLETKDQLLPGAKVQIRLDGKPQCTGYIEQVSARTSRNGTEVVIRGSNILFPAVRGNINPKLKFDGSTTVGVILSEVLADYGITNVEGGDELNLKALTGVAVGGKPRTDLQTLTVQDFKPHTPEGAYEFCNRVLKRLGYFIWAKADGSGVVVSKPDYSSKVLHHFIHDQGDSNNVLGGEVVFDFGSQASAIFATGINTGKENGQTRFRSIMVNPLCGTDVSGNPLSSIQTLIDANAGAKVVDLSPMVEVGAHRTLFAEDLLPQIAWVHDSESKTQAQLEAFVKREMSRYLRQAVSVQYELEGHGQEGIPFAVNTMVSAYDPVLGLVGGNYWVAERRFRKSKTGGTTSSLTLVLPHSVET